MNYELVIFDVDGTLVTTKSGATFRKTADDWQWLPGRIEKCAQLRGQGVKLAVATNQGGVAFGYFSKEAITREILKVVQGMTGIVFYPSALYICYTHPKATVEGYRQDSERRKPRPGMIFEAMETFDVLPEATLYVGDRPEDEQTAQAAGVAFMWEHEFFSQEQA